MGGTTRRSLRHDTVGLSTTEYVILLLVVACVTIAGWRILGTTAFQRASSASSDMGQLDQGGAGGGTATGSAGGGASSTGSRPRARLEDATADATPPPDPKDELTMPFALLVGAVLLLVAMFARRKTGGGKKSGPAGSR